MQLSAYSELRLEPLLLPFVPTRRESSPTHAQWVLMIVVVIIIQERRQDARVIERFQIAWIRKAVERKVGPRRFLIRWLPVGPPLLLLCPRCTKHDLADPVSLLVDWEGLELAGEVLLRLVWVVLLRKHVHHAR